jgi:tetratricopeptide (TPR) repeat protein
LRLYGQAHLRLAESDEESLARAQEAFEQIREREPGDVESMVSLGQIYLGRSRFLLAADVFRETLAVAPAHRGVHSLLVEALLRSGQAAEAESVLQDMLDVDPDFTRARLRLADLQSDRGDHRAAAENLRRAYSSSSADGEIRRRLGLELYRAGDFQGALAVAEAALASDSSDFGALYLKAVISIALGRQREAIDLLRELSGRRPKNLELTLLLARTLERQKLISEAAEVLDGGAKRFDQGGETDKASRARFEKAALLAREQDWENLVATVGPLIGAGGKESVGLLLLHAEALAQVGRRSEALEILGRQQIEAPATFQIAAKRAEILFDLGRRAEAQAVLGELVALDDLEALSLAAEIFQRNELHAESIPVLERALELQPRAVRLMFWLGAAYERSGQQNVAAEVFERLLGIDPQFAPALNYLGYMWAEGGQNLERALELVRQAVALEPDNGAYADSLGWAHFQLGNYEEARGHLERAAQLVGEDAVVFEHLGDLYVVLGRPDEAGDYYQRALELQNDNAANVQRKLDELRGD